MAPVTGALLARPAEQARIRTIERGAQYSQYPEMFRGTVFDTFPYLPPCLLGALVQPPDHVALMTCAGVRGLLRQRLCLSGRDD